jgi:hypothetical protein
MSGGTEAGLMGRIRARYAANRARLRMSPVRVGLLIAAAVLAVPAGYRVLTRYVGGQDGLPISFTVGVLPVCDSSPARRLLIRTLNATPEAEKGEASLQRIGTVAETGFVPVNSKGLEMRLCTADVFTSVGRVGLPFTLEWTSASKDELWIEAENPF